MAEQVDTQLIGELLALIAHDLRNPLSAMHSNMGFLQSLAPIAGDDDAADAVDDGLISCDGLSHIIDNIDLFGRALRGLPESAAESVDLSELARAVVARCESTARSHGLSIRLSAIEDSAVARTSHELASQALTNLVRNSVQHGGTGSIIRVSVRKHAGRVIVGVADSGVPLGDDGPNSPFSAAGQLDAKSIRSGRYSRGMGLYCAALAARAAGGEIHAVHRATEPGNAFELSFSTR